MEANTPPECRSKRGIPLGGIGTGSFMLNLAGGFGPWEFTFGDDSETSAWGNEIATGHEERFLRTAAFHIFQRDPKSKERFIATLATEDVCEEWPRITKGQGTYHALFPKGWFEYDGLLAPVTMRYFPPFLPRDYRTSSLPVSLFRFTLENPRETPLEVAVMFTFPNAIYQEDTPSYQYPRRGLKTLFQKENDILGIRLQAESPENVPATQKTEWVISAGIPPDGEGTYTT